MRAGATRGDSSALCLPSSVPSGPVREDELNGRFPRQQTSEMGQLTKYSNRFALSLQVAGVSQKLVLRADGRAEIIRAIAEPGRALLVEGRQECLRERFESLFAPFSKLEATTGVSWAAAVDIGGFHSGTVVSGVMNTLGNLGGAVSPLAFSLLIEWTGTWMVPFLVA